MYDNNGKGWTCCDCQGSIDKLPFEPHSDSNLRCFDCHKKFYPVSKDRRMYDNDGKGWTCCECGGNIDKLPFNPRGTDNLRCSDCFNR